jgi:hypothetical protein
MKQSIVNVLVDFLFFTGMFLLYNLLFQDEMGVKEMLLRKSLDAQHQGFFIS